VFIVAAVVKAEVADLVELAEVPGALHERVKVALVMNEGRRAPNPPPALPARRADNGPLAG
jgi:hypothetical protein